MAVLSILNYDTLNSSFYPCAAYFNGRRFLPKNEVHRRRALKKIKKRAAKAAAAAFVILGAVGVVSYASEADTAKTPFVLTFNTSTTGVFPRGVSYEGISLE